MSMRLALAPPSSNRSVTADEAALILVVIATPQLRFDHRFRRGLPEDFLIVTCAPERNTVLARCSRFAPCVLVTDEHFLGGLSTADFAALLCDDRRRVRIIAFAQADDDKRRTLLRLGCVGFLEQDAPAAVVRRAVRAVAEGEMWVSGRLLSSVFQELVRTVRIPCLTAREREVLAMVDNGLRNREIADRLCISHETVRWHIRTLHAKLKRERDGSGACVATEAR